MSGENPALKSDPAGLVPASAPTPTPEENDSTCACGDAFDRALVLMIQHCAEEIRKDPVDWLRQVRHRLEALAHHNPPGRPRQERITKAAAAGAVPNLVAVRQPGASLLPHIDDLRSVSATVAMAVVETAEAEGLAAVKVGDIVQQVQDPMWQPEHRHVEAS